MKDHFWTNANTANTAHTVLVAAAATALTADTANGAGCAAKKRHSPRNQLLIDGIPDE